MVASKSAEDHIRRVEALLNLASDPRTPEGERENAQAKANSIMFQFRIDQAMLFQKGGTSVAREVISREYDRLSTEEFTYITSSIRTLIFIHMGCMTNGFGKLTVVGYEDEIQMAEMLWAQIFLHFTQTVFPKWETYRSFDANVFELKTAGYSWPYVRDAGLRHSAKDVGGFLTYKNASSKLRTAFKREASRRNVEVKPGKQQPMNPSKWRKSFAEAYAARISRRLMDMRAKDEANAGKEGVLALVSEHDRIKQRFYELFPELHPEAQRRRWEQEREANQAAWDALTPEEQDRERRRQDREEAKEDRRAAKQSPRIDLNGWTAGARAAERADLGQGRVGASSGKELE